MRLTGELRSLAEQSVLNPYFRWSAIQTGVILFLLLVCWVWWDKMRQIKWVAAECLADAINAKRIAEDRALEAIGLYNRHIEQCNRVIESQESGLPGASPTDAWRQEVLTLKNKLTAEEAKSMRLQKALEDREALQAGLEQRLRQLETLVQERQNGANAELVATASARRIATGRQEDAQAGCQVIVRVHSLGSLWQTKDLPNGGTRVWNTTGIRDGCRVRSCATLFGQLVFGPKAKPLLAGTVPHSRT